MNSFYLKLIAIIAMVIDHVGAFIFPQYEIFRIIGRISFPIFAFLIANGAYYTKNFTNYLGRIFLFALLSQFPFYLAFSLVNRNPLDLNVLFTFFFALLAIITLKKVTNKLIAGLIVILCAYAAYYFRTDYGGFGVLITVSFYLFFKNSKASTVSYILIALLAAIITAIKGNIISLADIDIGKLISILSLIFILFYNYKEGPKTKYLFYIFYPLHFLVFYFLSSFTK
jgi:hypothetical protein